MTTGYRKITKEEFEAMQTMTYAEISNYVYNNLIDDSIRCGYGYYGCGTPRQTENGYQISFKMGSYCD